MIEKADFAIYIEGEKIPFSSASVSLTANEMSRANIVIPSSFSAPNIRRFSMVHIFYRSPYFYDSESKGRNNVKHDSKDARWYLLWEGVVVGYGFNKEPGTSGFTLFCADYLSYLSSTRVALFNRKMWDSKYNLKRLFVGQQSYEITGEPFVNWVSKYFVEKGIDINVTSEQRKSMAELCSNFAKNWSEDMPLMSFHTKRVRLEKKFGSVLDEAITKIFNAQELKAYVNNTANNMSGDVPVLAILEKMLRITYYNYVNIGPCPYYKNGNELRQIVLKPEIFFSAPPLCNLVFPDQCLSVGNSINYMSMATRSYVIQRMGDRDKGASSVYFSPKELADKIGAVSGGIDISVPHGTKEKKDDGSYDESFYLDAEIEGALIPQTINLPTELFSIDTDKGTFKNDRLKYMAEYSHNVQTLVNNTERFTLKFSPQIVADFPMAFLDKYASVTGYVLSVNHQINASGSCSTQLDVNMVRPLANGVSDIERPVFISEKFGNDYISSTYLDLIGCSSVMEFAGGPIVTDVSISGSINNIFNLDGKSEGYYYDEVKNGNAHQYISKTTFRKTATVYDVKKHYGMRILPENDKGRGVDDSWSHEGNSNINPFDYSRGATLDQYNFESSFPPEHKKKAVKDVVKKYKGIIDGR